MKKIGCISYELYNPDKLNLILKRVENAASQDQKQDYEILIDGFKAIPRNADPEKFESFSEFITSESECMAVHLYFGNSKHSDCFFFFFKQIPANKQRSQGLSGSPEDIVKQVKDKITKELHYEDLERENEELKAEIEELENILETKEEYWEKIKNNQLHSYGDIGGAVLTGIINSPQIKKMFPGLSALGGLGGHPEGQEQKEKEEEEGATFKSKGEKEETNQNNLSEQDQAIIAMFHHIEETLNESQLNYFKDILHLLVNNPVALKSTNKHILNFLNSKPKA